MLAKELISIRSRITPKNAHEMIIKYTIMKRWDVFRMILKQDNLILDTPVSVHGAKRTILSVCVQLGRYREVKDLLSKGCDPNITVDTLDYLNVTPLQTMCGVQCGKPSRPTIQSQKIFDLLVSKTNLSHRSCDGMTVMDMAMANGHSLWITALKSRMKIFSTFGLTKHPFLNKKVSNDAWKENFKETIDAIPSASLSWLHLIPHYDRHLWRHIPWSDRLLSAGLQRANHRIIRECARNNITVTPQMISLLSRENYWKVIGCVRYFNDRVIHGLRDILENSSTPMDSLLLNYIVRVCQ